MNIIFETMFGSHLYGTNTEASDVDRKGVYIPSAREILLHTYKDSINTTEGKQQHQLKNDCNCVDYEYFSLDKFIKMALQGETCVIDMLHSNLNHWYSFDNTWSYIHANRKDFYTKNMSGVTSYIKRQVSKYGAKGSRIDSLENLVSIVDKILEDRNITKFSKTETIRVKEVIDFLPENEYCLKKDDFYEVIGKRFSYTEHLWNVNEVVKKWLLEYGERARLARDNKNVDFKSVSHAMRSCFQLKEIYTTGDLIFPLKDADYLRQIKCGEIEWLKLRDELEELYSDVERLSLISSLPEKADEEGWLNFVCEIYGNVIKKSYQKV